MAFALYFIGAIPITQDLPMVYAEAEEIKIPTLPINPSYSIEQVKTLTDYYGEKYNVSSKVMLNVIQCETHFNNVQSGIYKDGVREDSWGIAQFHLPSKNKIDEKVITKEMAMNPNIAVEAMAQIMSKGQYNKWSCYRKIYGR